MLKLRHILVVTVLLILLLTPAVASAHVKWFAPYSYQDAPRNLQEVLSPLFFVFAALSFVMMGALVEIDRRLNRIALYQKVNSLFDQRRGFALPVMRAVTAAALILNWATGTLLAPELALPAPWVGWFQLVLVILLVSPVTTPLAGVGLLGLYGIAVAQFGAFHMIDYVIYVGVAAYLILGQVERHNLRRVALIALYSGVGFSLCWGALEKLVYPQWGMVIMEQNPILTMGLPAAFFLLATAFVEFCLGYLLIIGLLQRPIALAITGVFAMTTLVFGTTEIIGHLIFHGALIVFLLEGHGAQIVTASRRDVKLRIAMASGAFLLMLALTLTPYSQIAQVVHQNENDPRIDAGAVIIVDSHNHADHAHSDS